MKYQVWLSRPVAAGCLALALCAISFVVLSNADFGPREASSRSAMVVTMRHSGVDAREMERNVAIPLEDALAALPGAVETSSSSEYGTVRAIVSFSSDKDAEEATQALRDAVWRVYDRLPSSVQRPEICSSSLGRGPVWVAALSSLTCSGASLGRLMEHVIKPAFKKIPGVGDVELSGIGMPELIVEVDEALARNMGVSIEDVARAMVVSDTVLACGSISDGSIITTMVADGRFTSTDSLAGVLVASASGQTVRIGAFSRIGTRNRRPEALSRVDGEGIVTLAVNPGGKANLATLSRALAVESKNVSSLYGLDFNVLYDVGVDVSRSFRSTFLAALQGAVAVAAASALLLGLGRRPYNKTVINEHSKMRQARLVATGAVPFILLVSAASMSAMGYNLDTHVLAGLAVGLGASVDVAILVSERIGAASSIAEGERSLLALIPSLASGSATTIVVLLPLRMLDFMSEGVARVAGSIATVCFCSFLVSLLIIPPLILGGSAFFPTIQSSPTQQLLTAKRPWFKRTRWIWRVLARNAMMCAGKPRIPILSALALSLLACIAMVLSPLDLRPSDDESSVVAHIEFDAGLAMDSVDQRLARCAKTLTSERGIRSVQATARRGTGSMLISFDARKTNRNDVSERVRAMGVPGGFVWLPSPATGERFWELVVSGDDDTVCRSLAREIAATVSALPIVIDTVLNFKDGPDDVIFQPDRERSMALGVSLDRASSALRRSVYGPVAYKRIDGSGETDVRLTTLREGEATIVDAMGTLIQSGDEGFRLDTFMHMRTAQESMRILRRNRRRVASITLRTGALDPQKVRLAIEPSIDSLNIPPGYTIEFDREAMEAASRLRGVVGSFMLAAALVYMACATASESFGAPLAIMSSLAPSLAIPAILLALARTPLNPSIACAFVAVSGVVVNASVLTVEACRMHLCEGSRSLDRSLYCAMRARLGTLLATSGTSVAGALPFLLLSGGGNALVRSLAFVMATGTAASLLVALCVIPALASLAPALFRGFALSDIPTKKGILR